MNGNSGNPSREGPSRLVGPEVEVVRDFNFRTIGYVIRERDGQATAKDANFNTIGRFDGRKTVDGRGNNLFPGDITKTVVIDADRNRRR
ncbi:MAG: hypothetical protein ACKOCT_01245 [Alphaproteobacteria bacterium]